MRLTDEPAPPALWPVGSQLFVLRTTVLRTVVDQFSVKPMD